MWPFTVNCESCKESIWRWSKRCAYCGVVRGEAVLKEEGILAPPPAELEGCPSCKKPVAKGSNFCPGCGLGSASGTRKCNDPSCGARSPGDARYCVSCGRPYADADKPALRGETVWARTKDDLMARVEVRDAEGWFRRGFVVEFGTEALFLMDGKLVSLLEPGRHDLGGMLRRGIDLRARYEATAVVYDNSEFSLAFNSIKSLTRERVEILADIEVRLRIEDAGKLFTTVAKGADRLPRVALQQFLEPEVANGLGEAIHPHSVQDFRQSFSMKRDFEQALMNHLRRTLEHTGLAVAYLRVFNWRQERLDAQNQRFAEYYFQASDMTVETDGRRQVLSARQDLLGVERAEAAQQADHLRQSLEPRMAFLSATRNLQAVDWENDNLMAELRMQYDRAGFSRDLSFDQFRTEAQLNSTQALRTLQERLDQEYRQLTKLNEAEMVRLTGDVDVATAEQQQRVISTNFDAELRRQGIAADFGRTQKKLDSEVSIDIRRNEFEVNKIELEESRLAAAQALENHRGQLEAQRIPMEIRLAEQRGQMEIRLSEQRLVAEMMVLMKDIPEETLLAMKSPEHLAAVLRDRAGRDVAERYFAMQSDQQSAFLASMQQLMANSMAQNAKVAETAAQRPASVVFGPAFSNPTTIQPPVVAPPTPEKP